MYCGEASPLREFTRNASVESDAPDKDDEDMFDALLADVPVDALLARACSQCNDHTILINYSTLVAV